ncbi:c-type cytochrome [Aquamicrobium ahrensii]|uniref:Cytochrome c n=1 Tax=Aquamicrobium ahrensii TaxID=469551 RepID=A0ABV2KJY7_9HYPH
MLVFTVASPARAGDATAASQVEEAVVRTLLLDADPAYGEYLGGECVTCHRTSGASGGVPPIAGLPAGYTVRALSEYKFGLRDNNVMKLMATRLADDEVAALAAYFAQIRKD